MNAEFNLVVGNLDAMQAMSAHVVKTAPRARKTSRLRSLSTSLTYTWAIWAAERNWVPSFSERVRVSPLMNRAGDVAEAGVRLRSAALEGRVREHAARPDDVAPHTGLCPVPALGAVVLVEDDEKFFRG